jgi:hypothetical protein
MPLDKVRKIAFRLCVVNLAEDFPMLISASDMMEIGLDDELGDEEDLISFMGNIAEAKAASAMPSAMSPEISTPAPAPPPMPPEMLMDDDDDELPMPQGNPQDFEAAPPMSEDFLQELLNTLNNA